MIDVNVSLSRWPFRRLPHDETPRLVERLRKAEVVSAWVGSFDALLHRDLAAVNQRLAADCRQHADLLVPFGAVHPGLPDWRDDLRRCQEEHGMPGVRLHPDYHGYKLDDPSFVELLDECDSRRLMVQIALTMEDERTQHPLVRVPAVDPKPLAELLRDRPRLRVVVLNGLRVLQGATLETLLQAGQVHIEIATLEGIGGVAKLLRTAPLERVLLGSHFPFYYLDAALLKLRESELGGAIERAVTHDNAARLLAGG